MQKLFAESWALGWKLGDRVAVCVRCGETVTTLPRQRQHRDFCKADIPEVPGDETYIEPKMQKVIEDQMQKVIEDPNACIETKLEMPGMSTGDKQRMPSAMKFDDGKARFDLLPPEACEEIAQVFTYGANKYAPHNWRLGMDWSRLFRAMLGHGWAWWRGEERDKESGMRHVSHMACNAMMLLQYVLAEEGTDDRYKKRTEGVEE